MALLGSALALVAACSTFQDSSGLEGPPQGFVALFDGESLNGWCGLVGNPIERAKMSAEDRATAQAAADAKAQAHWSVRDGVLVSDGHGPHLCTEKLYGDFELRLDWSIDAGADSGIYLRGSPQVQIWDPVNGIDQAKVGSGGLYNNQIHPSKPTVCADRPAGEWNRFRILMVGERVTVELNGQPVVDDVVMENYWDRARPIFAREQIELQTHGGEVRFRNVFLREIPAEEANAKFAGSEDGFESLFDGASLNGWQGAVDGYHAEGGRLICAKGHGGTLLTKEQFDDFVLRFEFKLDAGSNNGLAIRTPPEGNPAYAGMELQILDNTAEKYATLQPWQYHGSCYGVRAAHRGYQRPVGTWNYQEVRCEGSKIEVRLNGTRILDLDLAEVDAPADGQPHPGMQRAGGHLGFMGHGDHVEFRNLRLRRLR